MQSYTYYLYPACKKGLSPDSDLPWFSLFKEGKESGLRLIYQRLFKVLERRATRYTGDDVAAGSLVQEAFLRLWILRRRFAAEQQVLDFLREEVLRACRAYFRLPAARFHRSLLRLDGIDNYQEFMVGCVSADPEEEGEPDGDVGMEVLRLRQWALLPRLIERLPRIQQLFIGLCLRYSFNYDRIAWHLGGISVCVVARIVEAALGSLRAACAGKNMY